MADADEALETNVSGTYQELQFQQEYDIWLFRCDHATRFGQIVPL